MDTLIVGGKLVDGTGNPWRWADVGLTGDRVSHVAPAGRLDPAAAAEVVDAAGHVVCPGFIDIQSHSIIPLLSDGRSLSKVTQGVTTEIMGELWTPAPFGGLRRSPFLEGFGRVTAEDETRARGWPRFHQWLDDLAERGTSVNVGSFLGGATVREYAMGWHMGPAGPDELAIMRRVVAEAMEDGAFGIAPALIYPPNSFSTDDELTACAEIVGRYGGVYIVHLRSEGDTFLEALDTTIELGRQARVAIEIYHLKATGSANWHKIPQAIAAIDRARASGVDIAANMYPYIASGTGLAAAMPDWAQADGKLADNLRDPVTRARIREGIVDTGSRGVMAGPEGVLCVGLRLPENQPFVGKTLAEIAAAKGQDWPDTLMDLVLAEGPWASAIYFMMTEDNLRLQLQQPWIKVSTDAGGLDPERRGGVLVHPRAYGTYPRVLGKYVRDESVISLEHAIRSMTSAVADRLGLHDRGIIRPSLAADIVIFDPATVADRATFTEPHQLSVGVRDVWVNGQRVLANGQHTGALPGRPVYGPGRA
ncbi:MAG: amidohydrolase family protein [Chloroflexi bacterium]|nr:amidohydrolase family protein [Chloroflexota bacterium]